MANKIIKRIIFVRGGTMVVCSTNFDEDIRMVWSRVAVDDKIIVGNTRKSISQSEWCYSDFLVRTNEWKINWLDARINEVKNLHTNSVNRNFSSKIWRLDRCASNTESASIYTFLVGRRML